MPENPYKLPEAEPLPGKPDFLRTIRTGALCGLAMGLTLSVLAMLLVKNDLATGEVLWPEVLEGCLQLNILLTGLGSTVAFVIGLIRS